MSMFFGPFTVTVGALAPIQTTQFPNANMAVFINESPYTLKVDPGTGSYFVISAFTQDAVPLGNQFSGVLKVTAAADVAFNGTPPVSVLYVQVYAKGEPLPGTYPAALARIMNVGNSVPLNASATSVANDGNPAGTEFVEASVSGIKHVSMTNAGFLQLLADATSSNVNMFDVKDLGASGHEWGLFLLTTHGVGWFDFTTGKTSLVAQSNGGFNSDGGAIATDGGGKLTGNKSLSGGNVGYFEMAPSDGVTWDVGELNATHGAAFFTSGVAQLEVHPTKGTKFRAGGLYLGGISEFTGTVTGVYNHNFGTTPDGCLVCQSVIGSQTMGYDTLGATTVHVTSGGGNAFYGTAYAMN